MNLDVKPVFGLIDANNFYVSRERVFNPKLKESPVVVLSSNDGCVISRSNEAKGLGIKMGQPLFQIQSIIKAHDIKYFSSNFSLYSDMSRRIMQVVAELVPSIEIYSIDEAFVDLSGIAVRDLIPFGRKIVKAIYQCTGIPTSIGMGPTKTLAKIANRIAKQNVFFQNVYLLDEETRHYCLKQTPIEEVWGIGRKCAEKLQNLNISNAYQLSLKNTDDIKKKFNKVLSSTVLELQGTPILGIEQEIPPKKQILVSKTFSKAVTELTELKSAVATHLCAALEKLRHQNSVASSFSVFIQIDRFKAGFEDYHHQQTVELALPSQDTQKFLKLATKVVESLYTEGLNYKKAGVMLSNISEKGAGQYDLFQEDTKKEDGLMSTLDKINARLGKGKIRFAVEGYKKDWQAKSAYRSPNYTTAWDEILVVKS